MPGGWVRRGIAHLVTVTPGTDGETNASECMGFLAELPGVLAHADFADESSWQ